ncbi:DUF6351 family protein [Pseudohongiella sp. SYSU M77423]|uniref:DUF6351 family protein n=1 Tax=Pseudohongiella sp. SYSU M77423 TaxID=3042312 RepID=UPI0024817524|nr:DUF6351 family protein [Pseudohongiella sp. SYSU M77423]MDH7943484.1 DUF6351 family protein [Pseudohongiella sp. SYSU M77423]
MIRKVPQLALTVSLLAALAACSEPDTDTNSANPAADLAAARAAVDLAVASSAPDQISGSSVLVTINGIDSLQGLTFLADDRPLATVRETAMSAGNSFNVLLAGLEQGSQALSVQNSQGQVLASIPVTSHPLSGPIFSGPQQYPFVCTSVLEWGVQPLVDHNEEWGFPVYAPGATAENAEPIGYSKDCMIEPFVEYHYMSTEGGYKPWPADGMRPADLATTTLTDGTEVDFVVRWERGTLNRFLYSFATLVQPDAMTGSVIDPGPANWNGRLLYHFEGGVGVGHSQGRVSASRARLPEALGQGYAVIYSSGNRTGEHYNLQVGGETALMVKEHFIKRFGVPDYTVAVGGSGGAIQQYVYQQNHPGLIDAGVAQYSYPDMVTQTIHVGDCELLEHYMDVTDRNNPRWQVTGNRSLIMGFNSTDAVPDPLADIKRQLGYASAPGANECIPAWRGLTPLSMNPHYGQVREQDKMHPPGIMDDVVWTHYDDLKNIYGVDENGWARTPWDNVGVQYGLQALTEGAITPEEFLDLNEKVGGWKHPSDMVQEGAPFLGEMTPENFDPWSSRNMNLSTNGEPAPRTSGDLQAISALYESGMVFDGQLNIPIIDWRHYLEHVLDMHNSHQSFSARQRIENQMGHSNNQLIWFTDARPEPAFDQTLQALEVLHEWVSNIKANPDASVAAARPDSAQDACFNTQGELIAQGDDVWNGILNEQPEGACTQQFPVYSTSRMVAGGPIEGSIFKCELKSLDQALADGTYGSWQPDQTQQQRLRNIFPQGVCDYSEPDSARPQ